MWSSCEVNSNFIVQFTSRSLTVIKTKLIPVALVRKQTMPTEPLPFAGEVSIILLYCCFPNALIY
jgi:hypothetical protein